MALCDGLISAGIARDCNAVNAAVGVDKDLILVNYDNFDLATSEVKDDGDSWFMHSIAFTIYSKAAGDRKILEELAGARVVAIAVDRSTGLYELFGADQGLKLSGLERAYTGSQSSNFYTITIATPEIAVIRESSIGELAVAINTAT